MFNGHTMSVVMDLNLIKNDLLNPNYVTVAAITSSAYPTEYPNIYYAGVLMPPAELMMEWADGNQMILQTEYPKYLMSDDCDDLIVALIAGLTRKNIVLYIPVEEFEIFGPMLLNHIYYTYGIVCNTATSHFNIDPSRIPLIISKFYLMNVMDPDVYLDMYPANYRLPDFVIAKLVMDLHPFDHPVTIEEATEYFNKLNASRLAKPKEMVTIVSPGDKS